MSTESGNSGDPTLPEKPHKKHKALSKMNRKKSLRNLRKSSRNLLEHNLDRKQRKMHMLESLTIEERNHHYIVNATEEFYTRFEILRKKVCTTISSTSHKFSIA